MGYAGTLISPKTGFEYPVEFTGEGEPTEADIADITAELARRESDTLRGPEEAATSSFMRGLAGIPTNVVKGAGAVASLVPGLGGVAEDLAYSAKGMESAVEEVFPVNPIYADTFVAKAPEALGQGVGFLGTALASGGAAVPLTIAGLSGAAGGADLASELELTGLRRAGMTLGFGAAEAGVEMIGGPGAPGFLRNIAKGTVARKAGEEIFKEAVEEPFTGGLQDIIRDIAVMGTGKETVNPFRPGARAEEFFYGAIGASPIGLAVAGRHATMTPEERAAIEAAPDNSKSLVATVIAGAKTLFGPAATPAATATAVAPGPTEDEDIEALTTPPEIAQFGAMASEVLNQPGITPEEAREQITQRLIDDADYDLTDAEVLADRLISSATPGAVAAPAVTTTAAPVDQTGAAAADLGASTTGLGTGSTAPAVSVEEDIPKTPTTATGEITEAEDEVFPPEGYVTPPFELSPEAKVRQELEDRLDERAAQGEMTDDEVIEWVKSYYPATVQPPANPPTPEQVAAHLKEQFGLESTDVVLFNRPDLNPEGFMHDGRIWINTARVQSPETLNITLQHEATHAVEKQADVRADVAKVISMLSPEEVEAHNASLKAKGYVPEQFPTETAANVFAELSESFRNRPAFQQLVQKIKTYFKETFRMTLNQRDAEVIAARVVAKGLAEARTQGRAAAARTAARTPQPSLPRQRGDFVKTERIRQVSHGPIGPNRDFAQPPSDEQAVAMLQATDKSKVPRFGQARNLPAGHPIGVRIDVPTFRKTGGYVQSVHEKRKGSEERGKVGDLVGYDTHVVIENPVFFVNQRNAELIREGMKAKARGERPQRAKGEADKFPIATIEGTYAADQSVPDPDELDSWTPTGFNPETHSYLYDKATDQRVIGGERAYSVGNTVFVKNPRYGGYRGVSFSLPAVPLHKTRPYPGNQFSQVLTNTKKLVTVSKGVNPIPNKPVSKNMGPAFDSLDALHQAVPNPIGSVDNWRKFISSVWRSVSPWVVDPPWTAMEYFSNPQAAADLLGKLSPSQIAARIAGMTRGKKFLQQLRSGEAGQEHLLGAITWGLLSRGVGAYPQEGGFMELYKSDLIPMLDEIISSGEAVDEAMVKRLSEWATQNVGVKGSGLPGAQATQNTKAFGAMVKAFVNPVANGKYQGQRPIDVLHDLWRSEMTGPQIRREFWHMFAEDNNSAQIDNKVLSFVLLVTGRNDVLVFDRVQFRHFWDAQRYQQTAGTGNIYDGITIRYTTNEKGKLVPVKSGLQPMGEAVQGLALYEAMERNLLQPIQEAYKQAGIAFDGIGSFHWDSWLAISGQAISHPTTELLLATPDTAGVEVSQGKYDETKYGLIYRFGGDFFLPYLDKPGGRILTARETDAINIENLRKAGVVPESKKLKSDAAEERLAPWIDDKDVDRGAYNRWAETLGVEASTEGGPTAPDGAGGRADVGRGRGPRVAPPASLPASAQRQAQDARYMGAVRTGDVATQQRIVDESAKAAGYTIRAVHGTSAKKKGVAPFTQFDTRAAGGFTAPAEDYPAAYFAPASDRLTAEGAANWQSNFGRSGKPFVFDVWLRIQNPINKRTARERGMSREDIIAAGYDGIIGTDEVTGKINEYAIFDPEQAKSADPVVRVNGRIVPPSERFNPESRDIRASLPSPTGSGAAPTRGAPGHTQVFGRREGPVREPGFFEPVVEVIKDRFFDSRIPVTPANIKEAFEYVTRLLDPAEGKKEAQEISAAITNPEDKNLGVGVLHTELMKYAAKVSGETGDAALFDFMQNNLNNIVIDDSGKTFRDYGQTVGGRSTYTLSGFMKAVKEVTDSRDEAMAKAIPEEVLDEIDKTVRDVEVTEEMMTGVGTKPRKKGKTGETTSVEEMVEEAIPVTPRRKTKRTILKEILAEPEPEVEPEPEPTPEPEPAAGAEVLSPETPAKEITTLPVPVEAEFVPKEKFGDDIIRYADQKAAEIREKIRKMLSERTSMGVDPTLIPLAVEYGALKLLKGGIKFTQWAAEMKSELGAWIDDIDMIDVWNKATARVKKFETTTAAPAPAPSPTPTEPGAAPTPKPKPKPPSKPRKAKPKPAATETEEGEGVEEVEEPEEEEEKEPEKPEVSAEDKTAQKYIDRVDESQVEILKPDAIENPVLKYIRAQEDPPFTKSKDDFVISATKGLEDLGVSTGVARETAERIWLRKEARRDAAVRRTEKAQKEATTKAAQGFISAYDKSQTEVVLPAKETNPAVKILRSAQKLEGDISKEGFVNSVRDELIGVGVEKGVAVNAATRAWAIRETKVKKAEARIKKRAEARGLTSAEKILNDFARLQSDTLSWTKKKLDPVRDAVRRAMSPKNRFVKSAFQAELVRLGVEPAIASSLAEVVARQKDINERIAIDELSQALATGAKGTLKPLEEILVAATPAQQRDPGFRKRQEVAYFTQLGLTTEQAAAAARLYDKEFTERLGEAIDSAIDKQAKTAAPWQQRMRKGSPALKKKMVTGLDRVKKAIRSGLLDPSKNWKNELAELNGWRGFTPEQYKRMSEIDDELSRPDIMDYESAKLIAEMNDIIAKAKIPETAWNQALSSYVAGVLSGLSTINVQFSAHTGLVRDFLGDLPTDPVMATKALLDAMGNVFSETKFALKNNVYTHNVDEHMKGHEQPLRQMFESGLKQLQSNKVTDKAMGYWKVFVGAQLYMTRVLNSLDQGFITTAQVYKTTLFTHRALQQLGMSRADAAGLIEEAMRAKAEAIENATEKGMDGEEAVVRANEIFLKEMYEVVAKQGPEGERLAEDVKIGAARESVGTVGRLSSDVTPVRLKTGGGGEGFLSTPINAIIDTINRNLLEHGGTEALKARMMFGFVTIPFRTARWYAGYSPYGFVRYFNHWRYERAGRTSPYQQSYGKESQVRQRLRDATLGTLLMAAAAAFAAGTDDDDPEKEEFKFFITGKGPRDKTLRDVWMKRFKPYALVVKVGKSYVPLNLGRAFESLSWGLAFAGALDDISIKQKGQEARNPLKDFKLAPELLGSYFGSLSQRSSFQGLNKIAAIGEGVNSERTAIDVANVSIFAASGFIPWKGALNSVTRLFTNPIDRNSVMGAIHANTPIIGPLAGRIALNTFGDPMGDQTIAGRLYAAGVPVTVRFPAGLPNEKAYDVVMQKGRGPAPARRNDIEKIYGPVPDEQFYEFSKIRGQALKKAMSANAAKLMAMDQEEYGEWVENVSRAENPKAAKAVGMVKPPKKQAQ